VAEPWEKGTKPVELPNPELNPLQNPTLGRNLGRWAQVYFTSPPEKREQAVVDLLRELETESEPATPPAEESSQTMGSPGPRLICPFCEQPNNPAHKYCGQCGSPLKETIIPAPELRAREARPAPVPIPPVAEPRAIAGPSAEENDLEWLREKSLSRLSDGEEPEGKWKYIVVALVMVVSAFGILQWLSNRPATLSPHPAGSSPAVTQQQSEPGTPAEAPTLTQDSQPTPSQPSSVSPAQRTSAKVEPSPAAAPEPTNRPSPPAAEGGSQELSLAQGYLQGKHGTRDSAEAAKWLWKAVAKKNSTADVLLADLYMNGDGVPKNCTQARLLLVAAVQKGQPTAAEKLRGIESGGCR